MDQLTTIQLEAVQRLISEPLRQAVRVEMQAGHDRLTAAIEKVAEQLTRHIADVVRGDRARDERIEALDRRLFALERFRAKVLVVYAALAILLSVIWSVLREWIVALARRR